MKWRGVSFPQVLPHSWGHFFEIIVCNGGPSFPQVLFHLYGHPAIIIGVKRRWPSFPHVLPHTYGHSLLLLMFNSVSHLSHRLCHIQSWVHFLVVIVCNGIASFIGTSSHKFCLNCCEQSFICNFTVYYAI